MEFALKYTLVRCLKPRTCSIQLWRLQHSNAKRNPNEIASNCSFDNGESGTPVLFFPKSNQLVELKSNTLPKNVSDLFNSVDQNTLKRKDDTSSVNHKKSQILDMFKKDPKNEISSDAEISINESPTVTFKGNLLSTRSSRIYFSCLYMFVTFITTRRHFCQFMHFAASYSKIIFMIFSCFFIHFFNNL